MSTFLVIQLILCLRIVGQEWRQLADPSQKTKMKTIPESLYIIPVGYRITSGYHAETADVNFVFDVDGIEMFVPVHRCILAVHSPVFRRMFYESELRESGDIK